MGEDTRYSWQLLRAGEFRLDDGSMCGLIPRTVWTRSVASDEQGRKWADALANKSVMTRTYFKDHLEPIAAQVKLVDSPRPFVTGLVPGRDELPPMPLSYRETPLPGLPGMSVFLAPGHTWGQQA